MATKALQADLRLFGHLIEIMFRVEPLDNAVQTRQHSYLAKLETCLKDNDLEILIALVHSIFF